MSLSLSLTEAQAMTAFGNFIAGLGIVPNGQISRGQQNQVALSSGPNWIKMTPLMRPRLSTPVDAISVSGSGTLAVTTGSVTTTFRMDVQVDCYGPLAEDTATYIAAFWRDQYAYNAMQGTGVVPLYHSDMRNLTFINDQAQYEYRWSLDLSAEIDPIVTYASQSADTLTGGVFNVDATFPP